MTNEQRPELIPVFASRTEGAGPMTEDEAQELSKLINRPRHYTRGKIEVWVAMRNAIVSLVEEVKAARQALGETSQT